MATRLSDRQERLSHQWSTVVVGSATNDRGDIRRSGDPTRHPELGYVGCRTLYEGFRRGCTLNPLGACLGFRAVGTNGMATPYIYSSYTEMLARVNAFAAGLETLNLVPPTKDDNMVLIGLYMKNCMEWFIAEQAIFCVSGATGQCLWTFVDASCLLHDIRMMMYRRAVIVVSWPDKMC